MNFNIFDDQMNRRRENDRRMFEEALSDLVSVLGIDARPGETLEKEKAAKGALEEILVSLGAKIPEVPDTITDLNAQFEYMLRPSGVMRRRVELTGGWWKDAVGALLGSTLNGDVIAVMPAKYAGYEYFDPQTCRRIKINKKTAQTINTDAFCFYRPLPAKKLSLLDLGKFMIQSISRADVVFVLVVSFCVSLDYDLMMAPVQSVAESVSNTGAKMEQVITDETQKVFLIFLVIILILLPLVFITATWLSKSITKPVGVLADGAKSIGIYGTCGEIGCRKAKIGI